MNIFCLGVGLFCLCYYCFLRCCETKQLCCFVVFCCCGFALCSFAVLRFLGGTLFVLRVFRAGVRISLASRVLIMFIFFSFYIFFCQINFYCCTCAGLLWFYLLDTTICLFELLCQFLASGAYIYIYTCCCRYYWFTVAANIYLLLLLLFGLLFPFVRCC